jgi:phenylalanyl-tRNA synthetase beta chain
MNILIPDSWLREYLKTKATPKEIKEYLSLCGPSVERVKKISNDLVYDIEITTNRPDAMSVVGVAREAAAILPRFGIPAKLVNDPYSIKIIIGIKRYKKEGAKKLSIKTDPRLNPRWSSIVLTGVHVGPSPLWLRQKLEATGVRSINNVIDITNYLLRAYGQPAHAFDYDEIEGAKMTLRESRRGEKIVTLDGKTHRLPGGDIVIEDGAGRIIDLCGIMGAENSSIKATTTTVVLFTQTYNPANIRKTSMALAARSEASSLFEKGLDSELTLPALTRGVELMEKLAGANVASKLYDFYPKPYKPYSVAVSKQKAAAYIGVNLTDAEIKKMVVPLGFTPSLSKKDISVMIPSYRTDVALDVDVIEEIARIYGYHNIPTKLPDGEPPVVIPDPQLAWEHEIKVRLRDWGFTELCTYSMISEKLMDIFGLDTKKAYKISNPLSEEWVYMRPTLWPSVLSSIEQNLHNRNELRVFELSMRYVWRPSDLPKEKPMLLVGWTGHRFREAKGLGQAILALFGLKYQPVDKPKMLPWYSDTHLQLGEYGSVGEVNEQLLNRLNIHSPITVLELDIETLIKSAKLSKIYRPVSKYPPIVEDLSFVVPQGFQVGPLIDILSRVHKLIESITFLDAYENKRTFRITYSDPTKTLTVMDIAPIRQKLIEYAGEKFGASVATT